MFSQNDGILVFALLSLAIAIGFWFGRRSSSSQHANNQSSQPSTAVEGINQLLNEQPDAALDAFISSFDVTSETLETHLALGTVLRKRGEADRAIRVHQNLLARPKLSENEQQSVQNELALDYLASGLFDRAEALFKILSQSNNVDIKYHALSKLVDIYQGQNEWAQALETAELLCSKKNAPRREYWRSLQAHFCCELAEKTLAALQYEQAEKWISQAQSFRKSALRPMILNAKLLLAQEKNTQAIRQLKSVAEHQPHLMREVLPLLSDACGQELDSKEWGKFVHKVYEREPSLALLPALCRTLEQDKGTEAAFSTLKEELQRWSMFKFAADFLDLFPSDICAHIDLSRVYSLIEENVSVVSRYECDRCGFSGHQHYWQCPTCKSWDSVHCEPLMND